MMLNSVLERFVHHATCKMECRHTVTTTTLIHDRRCDIVNQWTFDEIDRACLDNFYRDNSELTTYADQTSCITNMVFAFVLRHAVQAYDVTGMEGQRGVK